jgi:hypothetical protein
MYSIYQLRSYVVVKYQAFISPFKHTNNAYYVDCTQQHCHDFPKNLDSNAGLLFLSRMRCPMRQAA